jgi:hypothetical protein
MTKPLENPAGPVVLSANCIADGRFIPAGSETPFTEETLPEHLRQYLARGDEEPFYSPAERNIYDLPPHLRRQARQALGNVQWQDWAEEVASEPLPAETAAVLQTKHDEHIASLKAQGAYAQKLADAAYEQAAAEASAQQTQYFVRRGGMWAHVERAKLRPGETCFVKRENGQMEAAGCVDSTGSPPPSEIIP